MQAYTYRIGIAVQITGATSYCNATGAPIGVWTNGEKISHYHRKAPNYFEDITDIPKTSQILSDILSERFTLKDLIIKDKLSNERKSLKDETFARTHCRVSQFFKRAFF